MISTKFKFGLGALVLAGAVMAFVIQHRAQETLRAENQRLRNQVSQLKADKLALSRRAAVSKLMLRLPSPRWRAPTPPAQPAPEDQHATNLYVRFEGQAPKLTAEQVAVYLEAYHTNAASLLAAYRTSGDPAMLEEAMKKYPNDPRVAFEALMKKDLSPEVQHQWLDAFKQSAPENALANYLSALNDFKAGEVGQAIQELSAASGKSFQDYTLDRIQDDMAAYLSAGYAVAEAGQISFSWAELPQLLQMRQLGHNIIDLANAYRQSGDTASARSALQMATQLGQNVSGDSPNAVLISQLVGAAIQRMALNTMDPNSAYGPNGQTVEDQLNHLAQNTSVVKELAQQAEPLMPAMTDEDWILYENRRMISGELGAMRWVVDKYGRP